MIYHCYHFCVWGDNILACDAQRKSIFSENFTSRGTCALLTTFSKNSFNFAVVFRYVFLNRSSVLMLRPSVVADLQILLVEMIVSQDRKTLSYFNDRTPLNFLAFVCAMLTFRWFLEQHSSSLLRLCCRKDFAVLLLPSTWSLT